MTSVAPGRSSPPEGRQQRQTVVSACLDNGSSLYYSGGGEVSWTPLTTTPKEVPHAWHRFFIIIIIYCFWNDKLLFPTRLCSGDSSEPHTGRSFTSPSFYGRPTACQTLCRAEFKRSKRWVAVGNRLREFWVLWGRPAHPLKTAQIKERKPGGFKIPKADSMGTLTNIKVYSKSQL